MNPRFGTGLVLLLVGLAAAPLSLRYDGALLPNDAAQYLSVANHVLRGEGLKTDLVFFEEHHQQSTLPVAETGFAPGYPLLIAAVASCGLALGDAAFLIDSLCFVAIPVLLFSLARRSAISTGIAVAMVAVWLALMMGWYSAWERLSELPFALCTLLALRLLPRVDNVSAWRWSLAGVSAAAAIALRYAGVSFLLATVMILVAEVIRRRNPASARGLVMFSAAPGLVLLGIVGRNLRMVGQPLGGNAQFGPTSLPEVLGRLAKAVQHLSGFTRRGFERLEAPEAALLAVILLVLALGVWQRHAIVLHRENLSFLRQDRRLRIAGIYVVVTLALLLWIDLRSAVTLQARMLVVLVPFILLPLGALLSAVHAGSRQARVAAGVAAALMGAIYIAGQFQVVTWQRSRPNHFALVREALMARVEDRNAIDVLREMASTKHPLLGNEPQMLGAVTQRPVVGLPPPPYSDRIWSFEEVERVVELYGIEMVVFMPRLQQVTSERVPFFDRLAAGELPAWLDATLRDERLQLFQVIEGAREPQKEREAPSRANRGSGLAEPDEIVGPSVVH